MCFSAVTTTNAGWLIPQAQHAQAEAEIIAENLGGEIVKNNNWFHIGKVRKLSDLEKGYIAGFIDGEGSLYVGKYTDKTRRINYRFDCKLRIINVDKNVLYRLKDMIGCGYVVERKSEYYRAHGWSQQNEYGLCSNGLRELLPQIVDVLIIKKKHALLVIEFLKSIKTGRNLPFGYTKRQLEIYEELRSLQGHKKVQYKISCGKWRMLEKQKYGRKTEYNAMEVP